MADTKHQKHPKLIKPEMGRFGRNEWALHGTNCSDIQKFAKEITGHLKDHFRICYVDTDHRSYKEELQADYLSDGAKSALSDKQTFQQIETNIEHPDYDYKFILQEHDLIMLNGNHHTGKKQIVFLDESKVESLAKRSDQLTDIQAFIIVNSYNVVPTHIIEQNPEYKSIPFFTSDESKKVAELIAQNLTKDRPPLKALILAGGKSVRMGKDKGQIDYHGKSQIEYMSDLASEFVEDVYISCRPDQTDQIVSEYPLLPDRIEGMGPYGGILSAFMQDPNAAWLVMACDLPLINRELLQDLIGNRDISTVATSFQSPVSGFPEPLITIWEPRAYIRLLQFMNIGYSCPRKVLINSEVHVLQAQKPEWLMNVNTPEDLERAKSIILEQA